jgi:hypothetical protein
MQVGTLEEYQLKEELSKEINRLIFQRTNENIKAVRLIISKE